jgi:PAS domain S-box-containing protein
VSAPGKKTILLVEDEPLPAATEGHLLEASGYAVVHASTATEAIEAATAPGNAIDLILMDVDLGKGMDGTHAAAVILSKKYLPIVFLTSHAEREFVDRIEKVSAYGYVLKSGGSAVLLASIRMAFKLFDAHCVLRSAVVSKSGAVDKDKCVASDARLEHDILLRVFFDNAEDFIMVNALGPGGAPGKFLEVNESLCKALGYTRKEMLELTPVDITDAVDLQEMFRISQQLMTEGRANYEVVGKRKDGENRTFEVKANLVAKGEDQFVVSVCRDITIRKQVETLRDRRLSVLSGDHDWDLGLTFTDLFDLDEIQEIQDAFAAATGVASIITDPAGIPITKSSGFCRLCEQIIRKTSRGLQNCYHSDKMIGKMNPDGPIAQPCLSGGLWDGGTSIQVGDRPIANWLIGQVLDDSIDRQRMLDYCREIGADPKEFEQALGEVTRMPKEQFLKICNALFLIARLLSRLAQQNVQQAHQIAERQRVEEQLQSMVNQRGALLQELQHRVKNNLSIISSLLSLELPKLKDASARQVFVDAESRIRAMAKIYEQLYRSDTLAHVDLESYISDLARNLVANYALDPDRVHLRLAVEPVSIEVKRAVPIGLILNELITNAMKYAFPLGARGTISVELKRSEKEILFSVADDGIGLPKDFTPGTGATLGLTLTQLLVEQLDGTLTIDGQKGARLSVRFPL